MKKLPLTKGGFAIVDDEDFHYLSRFSFGLNFIDGLERVTRTYTNKQKHQHIRLEDMIIQRPHGGKAKVFYFKNGDRLDFRKENLDLMYDRSSNHQGRKVTAFKGKPPLSKYKGVTWNFKGGRRMEKLPWRAQIQLGKNKPDDGSKRVVKVKCFATEIEAALWYNERALEWFGKNAFQNIIKD